MADYRLTAARVAGLAGSGLGRDAAGLDQKERGRLRRQALDWLRADLEAWGRQIDGQPGWVAAKLRRWPDDPSFKAMRASEVWSQLPEAERQSWKKLWDDVAATLDRAQKRSQEKLLSEEKPGGQ
jgi:hypothetical protein